MTGTCRKGSANYKFKSNQLENSESEPLTLRQQVRICFNKKNPIESLFAGHYYQPTTDNYPSYDSFVYEPESREVTAFQVTIAERHDFSSKGVIELHKLGQRLQIGDLKIRVIVVVFEHDQVTLTVGKALCDSSNLKVYTLRVTEDQLYRLP